jgi:hypothetical protein
MSATTLLARQLVRSGGLNFRIVEQVFDYHTRIRKKSCLETTFNPLSIAGSIAAELPTCKLYKLGALGVKRLPRSYLEFFLESAL